MISTPTSSALSHTNRHFIPQLRKTWLTFSIFASSYDIPLQPYKENVFRSIHCQHHKVQIHHKNKPEITFKLGKLLDKCHEL